MPVFKITDPSGKTRKVTAPEGTTREQAIDYLKSNMTPEAPQDPGYQLSLEDKAQVRDLRGSQFLPSADPIIQGATLGFADEMAAGLGAPIDALLSDRSMGESYDRSMAIQDYKRGLESEEKPIRSMIGEMAGGVMTGGALAKGGLTFLGGGARPLASRVGRGALEGAAYGGVAGMGQADTGEILQGAGYGAALGGTLGGAIPLATAGIGAGAGKAGRLASRLMHENPTAKQAGLSPTNYNTLKGALADDLSGGVNRISAAGDDAMLADAGPGAAGLLDAVAQVPGGRQVALANVGARVGAASKRIGGALDDALGKPGESSSRALRVFGDKSNPLDLIYKRAYSKPIDYSSETGRRIEGLVKSRVPKGAINAANQLMRLNGESSKQIMAKVADDGSVIFETMPDVRQLDYITRGLNQVADVADGKGALGGTTALGRAYSGLSREIRIALKESVPEYKDALNVAADAIRTVKARDVGKIVLSPRMTREELAETLSDMGEAELRKVSEGVRMQIDDTMANVKRAMTDTNMDAREAAKALGDLSGRANREKLSALLGPEKAQRLFAEIDQADKAFQLRAAMAQNSKTAPRQLFNDQNKAQAEGGIVNQLKMGQPIGSARSLTQKLFNRTPQDLDAMASNNAKQLAEALTGRRGAEAGKLAKLLMKQEPEAISNLAKKLRLDPKTIDNLLRGMSVETGFSVAR